MAGEPGLLRRLSRKSGETNTPLAWVEGLADCGFHELNFQEFSLRMRVREDGLVSRGAIQSGGIISCRPQAKK